MVAGDRRRPAASNAAETVMGSPPNRTADTAHCSIGPRAPQREFALVIGPPLRLRLAEAGSSSDMRLYIVLSGSVRHGDWAVAGECFGGRSRRMRSRSPRRRTFQFLGVAQCWARGVTGVGISCNV